MKITIAQYEYDPLNNTFVKIYNKNVDDPYAYFEPSKDERKKKKRWLEVGTDLLINLYVADSKLTNNYSRYLQGILHGLDYGSMSFCTVVWYAEQKSTPWLQEIKTLESTYKYKVMVLIY